MSFRNNRDSIFANLAQQSSSLLIFLIVPHLLTVENYGQITFVATLLSFIGIADLGFSYVYSRTMPGLYGRNAVNEIAFWNGNIIRFRLYCSVVFAVIISVIYFSKYGDLINSILLMMIPPMTVITAFGVAGYVAQDNFSVPRDISVIQALGRLITIPGVKLFGLFGWFVAQLLAVCIALLKRDFLEKLVNSWKSQSGIDWKLIRGNLPEALCLGFVAVTWLQLLSIAKLYAVFSYSDYVIAQYGLASGVYMIISSLVIAAFVPQTVKTYRMLDVDKRKALDYVFKSVCIAYPVIAFFALIAAFIAPYFFKAFYAKYGVTSDLTNPIILSLISYPAIVTLGAILVGTKKSHISLILLIISSLLSFIVFKLTTAYWDVYAAAHTQFIVLPIYAASLVITVFWIFRDMIESIWRVWLSIMSIVATPLVFYGLCFGGYL